jgi:hypothetical protein
VSNIFQSKCAEQFETEVLVTATHQETREILGPRVGSHEELYASLRPISLQHIRGSLEDFYPEALGRRDGRQLVSK